MLAMEVSFANGQTVHDTRVVIELMSNVFDLKFFALSRDIKWINIAQFW